MDLISGLCTVVISRLATLDKSAYSHQKSHLLQQTAPFQLRDRFRVAVIEWMPLCLCVSCKCATQTNCYTISTFAHTFPEDIFMCMCLSLTLPKTCHNTIWLFSFDMRGPQRQCRFPIGISRPLHRPHSLQQRWRRRQAPGAQRLDPCSLPPHLSTKGLLSAAVNQKPQIESMGKKHNEG